MTAYLDARHEEWMELYRTGWRGRPAPKERVLAVFDAYADHADLGYEHGFRGCGLLNAAAELPAGDPGRTVVRRHKEEVETLLSEHVAELIPYSLSRRVQWPGIWLSCLKGRWPGRDLKATTAASRKPDRSRPP